jgi:hypothetical protein
MRGGEPRGKLGHALPVTASPPNTCASSTPTLTAQGFSVYDGSCSNKSSAVFGLYVWINKSGNTLCSNATTTTFLLSIHGFDTSNGMNHEASLCVATSITSYPSGTNQSGVTRYSTWVIRSAYHYFQRCRPSPSEFALDSLGLCLLR